MADVTPKPVTLEDFAAAGRELAQIAGELNVAIDDLLPGYDAQTRIAILGLMIGLRVESLFWPGTLPPSYMSGLGAVIASGMHTRRAELDATATSIVGNA